jgi:hypothetical protein
MLVVEPDYLPDLEVFFGCAWTPFPNGVCVGACCPITVARGVERGATNFL